MSSVMLLPLVALLLIATLQVPTGVDAQAAPAAPKWPERFTVNFNETAFLPVRRKTEGTWYYDPLHGLELVTRTNGRGDRYCGSIHPLSDTPCNHLVTGGVRYLIFPDLGTCCKCCTEDHGCGVLKPTWLEGATYEGPSFLNGFEVDQWQVKGLQRNNAYFIRNTDTPVEVDQVPLDYIFMQPGSFSEGPIDADVFMLPPTCSELQSCPFFSTCTVARGFGPK